MKPQLREAKEEDFEFAFKAKKDAMGPHISSKWGWDENFQLNLHRQRWNEKPWFIISLDEEDFGTVSLDNLKNGNLRFGEFYILTPFRNRGLGSIILDEILRECDLKKRKIELEYLKWNPVGNLYKRHGFVIKSENEIHYFMEREACF